MSSRFMTSNVSKCVSLVGKRSFNSALSKMTSQLYSYPQENVDLQDKDIIISSNSTNDNVLLSHVIDCLKSCSNPNTLQKDDESRIITLNAIPSELEALSNKNIKKIVCCRDPKQSALSFFEWKKSLLYSTSEYNKFLLNKRIFLREYLFSSNLDLGYTPYSFLVEWYQYLNNNPNNNDILFLFYEDFIYNKKETLTILADHLNLDVNYDLLDSFYIENLFKNDNFELDDELNDECNNYWREYVGFHIGDRYINYDWLRFTCSQLNY